MHGICVFVLSLHGCESRATVTDWAIIAFCVCVRTLDLLRTQAVKIIAVMSECTGNFIRSRLMSDVIPVFLKVLRQPVPAK